MKKCALVTGGSRGIGRAIAIQLAKDHAYHVLINYSKNISAAEETRDEIVRDGGSAEVIQFNVEMKKEVCAKLIAWKENNPDDIIEVLVNNAGITKDNLLLWMSDKEWGNVLDESLNVFIRIF